MNKIALTRRHFEFIAAILAKTAPIRTKGVAFNQWAGSLVTWADHLEQTNENFNRARFLKACSHLKAETKDE
jgi:hypothetical protein